jgi:hypothetical protein
MAAAGATAGPAGDNEAGDGVVMVDGPDGRSRRPRAGRRWQRRTGGRRGEDGEDDKDEDGARALLDDASVASADSATAVLPGPCAQAARGRGARRLIGGGSRRPHCASAR